MLHSGTTLPYVGFGCAAAAARCCFARAASSWIRASAARRLEVPSPEGAQEDGARIGAEAGRDMAALINADEPYIEEPRTAEPAGAPLDIGAFKAPPAALTLPKAAGRGEKHGTIHCTSTILQYQ